MGGGSRCRSSWVISCTSGLVTRTVQHRDGVTIADAHHAAGEVGGEGLTSYESDAKEQKQGGNRVGTAHGMSGTVWSAVILRESGRKGDSAGEC